MVFGLRREVILRSIQVINKKVTHRIEFVP
jgi:hypothetical protein